MKTHRSRNKWQQERWCCHTTGQQGRIREIEPLREGWQQGTQGVHKEGGVCRAESLGSSNGGVAMMGSEAGHRAGRGGEQWSTAQRRLNLPGRAAGAGGAVHSLTAQTAASLLESTL